jgi:hypothetical protein
MPTGHQGFIQWCAPQKAAGLTGPYRPYQGDRATAGPLYRQTVKSVAGQPVERLVMIVNVRYPRPNKNNRNPFRDSLY